MEDREGEAKSPREGHGRSEQQQQQAVRSRWTPKPEQILILESIFNSGMVNPPKDETVRIRKLLEKFGSVGDANVFYWFQNRRSRSRRRQRQIQAGLLTNNNNISSSSRSNIDDQIQTNPIQAAPAAFDHYEQQLPTSSAVIACFASSSPCLIGSSSASTTTSAGGGGGGNGIVDDDLFHSISQQMGIPAVIHQNSSSSSSSLLMYSSDTSNLHYQSTGGGGGSISVYINGVATEVPRGPFDIAAAAAMLGGVSGSGSGGQTQDHVMLVHSSGVPVPVNEYGLVMLEMGESYFLVSGPT